MTALRRLDAWLAKTLFHPPIILACQLTRQTQYAIYRALWFFAACHATYYAPLGGWFWPVFAWTCTIILFLNAVMVPDVGVRSWGAFRLIIWIFVLLGAVVTALNGDVRPTQVREFIILFAEYAATIRSIPPRRPREKRTSAKEART